MCVAVRQTVRVSVVVVACVCGDHGGVEAADLAADSERVQADEEGIAQPGQGTDLCVCVCVCLCLCLCVCVCERERE